MTLLAQELAAYAAVLTAAVWLLLRWFRRRRTRQCQQCASPKLRSDRRHLPVVR
jgi:hypothetical protein